MSGPLNDPMSGPISGMRYALLDNRGLLAVGGADSRAFLQGLVSNDVNKVSSARAIWAALLTPQGKFLHEFFIVEIAGALVLDCEAARLPDLKRRLSLYKLRAQVTIEDRSNDFAVAALFGEGALAALGLTAEAGAARADDGGAVFADPRFAAVGARAIVPRATVRETLARRGFAEAGAEAYDRARIVLGLPDGSRDLEIEKAILLENGFDELNGVAWDKGCYMGQELTARTKYRGLIKKRLMPVSIAGPIPAPGTPVTANGEDAGEMRSSAAGVGLALLRLERLGGGPLNAGGATLTPIKPDWAKF
ncbi:MAG: folate-binding protein [Pseudomonadota bacterium]